MQAQSNDAADDCEVADAERACRILGGQESPINPATLYRGVKLGKYPPPIKLGDGTSRWLVRELIAVKQAAIAARDARREVA